jgi:hypothetical protein
LFWIALVKKNRSIRENLCTLNIITEPTIQFPDVAIIILGNSSVIKSFSYKIYCLLRYYFDEKIRLRKVLIVVYFLFFYNTIVEPSSNTKLPLTTCRKQETIEQFARGSESHITSYIWQILMSCELKGYDYRLKIKIFFFVFPNLKENAALFFYALTVLFLHFLLEFPRHSKKC